MIYHLNEVIIDRIAEEIVNRMNEPRGNMVASEESIDLYRKILSQADDYFRRNGIKQAEKTKEIFEKAVFTEEGVLGMAKVLDKVYGDIGGFKEFVQKMADYQSYRFSNNLFNRLPYIRRFSKKYNKHKDALDFFTRNGKYYTRPYISPNFPYYNEKLDNKQSIPNQLQSTN
jgi:hypothetical protein